jgi:hypothetical protein
MGLAAVMAHGRHFGRGKEIANRVGFGIENLAVRTAYKPRTTREVDQQAARGSPRKKETPKDNLGGKRKAVFRGYAG